MALSDSLKAIGKVGELLDSKLSQRRAVDAVQIGRPEEATSATGAVLNLFLYQVDVDGHLNNEPLDEGQPTPLWLVLKYLLTAYDADDSNSNSTKAHQLLGEAMLALRELNYIRPDPVTYPELADNPEPLKVTFNEGDPELLSKLMQGSEDKYRLSVPFEVRPVMIFPGEAPAYAPLVETVGPEDEGPAVFPTLGPTLTGMAPERFEAGDDIEVLGKELSSAVEQICLGDTCFGVTAAPAGRVRASLSEDPGISAGSYAVTVTRTSPGGRRMRSNAVLGHLLPTLDTAAPVTPLTDEGSGTFSGDLTLTGNLLGGPEDEIFVAFYGRDGVVLMLEPQGALPQTSLTVTVPPDKALPTGRYRVLLRVNGEQAVASPEVDWS